MDYRILFVYADASCTEVYASTEADVLHQIAIATSKTLHAPHHNHMLSIHVTNVALQGRDNG